MSLVVVERQTARSKTGRQMVESSRGWLQQPETNDGRQILDDVLVRVAGMMLMNADGGDQAGREHEPADQGMAGPDEGTLGSSERHDRDLVVNPLWKSQPVKNCKSVGDVVMSTKTKHQTSLSIEYGLELSHQISWQPDQVEVSVVKSRVNERH